jgi:hypothetical protein
MKLRISRQAKKVFGSVGLIIGLFIFSTYDLYAKASYLLSDKEPNGIIECSILFAKDFGLGLVALIVFCTIGAAIMIVSAEIYIRACDYFNIKPRLYNFLTKN